MNDLDQQIAAMQKKVRLLERSGPGAGMATAVATIRLRELQAQRAELEEYVQQRIKQERDEQPLEM